MEWNVPNIRHLMKQVDTEDFNGKHSHMPWHVHKWPEEYLGWRGQQLGQIQLFLGTNDPQIQLVEGAPKSKYTGQTTSLPTWSMKMADESGTESLGGVGAFIPGINGVRESLNKTTMAIFQLSLIKLAAKAFSTSSSQVMGSWSPLRSRGKKLDLTSGG
ncbi:9995_t:CDS:2, partial [Racocetra fulgida]